MKAMLDRKKRTISTIVPDYINYLLPDDVLSPDPPSGPLDPADQENIVVVEDDDDFFNPRQDHKRDLMTFSHHLPTGNSPTNF